MTTASQRERPAAALAFSQHPLPLSCPTLRAELAAFAEAVLPGSGAYVESRLDVYDEAVVARSPDGVAACELIQAFDVDGAHFVYLGPLFSRRGAYFPLFAWYVGRLAESAPDRPLYLAAEVQSPEVLLAFHALFPHSAFPRVEDGGAPADAREAAEALAARLDHLGALEPGTLATRSGQTLYAPRPGCEPVLEWLRARGIDPARGDSQLVVLRAGASVWERAVFFLELAEGLEALRAGAGRASALELFRRAVRG
jgi:hypothetical protein